MACWILACSGDGDGSGGSEAGDDGPADARDVASDAQADDSDAGQDGAEDVPSDGAPDAGDGVEEEEPPFDPYALPPEIGDGDADGNGITDRDEYGPLGVIPADADLDGSADYLDVDDDADGLLDVNDPHRLEPEPASEGLQGDLDILEAWGVFDDDVLVAGVLRVGDELKIDGVELLDQAEDHWILLLGGGDPLNLRPARIEGDALFATVPAATAVTSIRIFAGGVFSSERSLVILPAGAPVLASASHESSGVVLTGIDLEGVTSVSFGDVDAAPDTADTDSVTLALPDDAMSGTVMVSDGTASSNTFEIAVLRDLAATVVLPEGIDLTGRQVAIWTDIARQVAVVEGAATARVARDTFELVSVLASVEEPVADSLVGMALALEEDTSLAIDAESTAAALSLLGAAAPDRVQPESLDELRADALELTAVADLATDLSTALAADIDALASPDEDLAASLTAALVAVDALIEDGLELGTYVGFQTVPAPGIATITPEEQYDIKLLQIPDTGNIQVENDSQLYLSIEVRDVVDDRVVQRHIQRGYDRNIIEPQASPLRLFNAGSKDFEVPNYHSARVTVVTPGIAAPRPESEAGRRAQLFLQVRTLMDRIFWPAVSLSLGLNKLAGREARVFAEEFVRHNTAAMDDVAFALEEGDIDGATRAIGNALMRDLESFGPVTRAVMNVAGRAVAARIGISAATRAAPVVGQIVLALDVIDIGGTTISIYKVLTDLATTPGELEFDVIFDMAVTDVTPTTVDRRDGYELLSIDGYYFVPIEDDSGDLLVPTVQLFDEGGGARPRIDLNGGITPNARHIAVIAPPEFMSRVVGPIRVEVARGEDRAVWPGRIQVNGHRIHRLEPDFGEAGDTIAVIGEGFAPEAYLEVQFRDAETHDRLHGIGANTVDLETATSERLSVTVPELPADRPVVVVVAQGSAHNTTADSNPVPYSPRRSFEGFWTFQHGAGGEGCNTSGGAALGLLPGGRFIFGGAAPFPPEADARTRNGIAGVWTFNGTAVSATGCRNTLDPVTCDVLAPGLSQQLDYELTWDPETSTFTGGTFREHLWRRVADPGFTNCRVEEEVCEYPITSVVPDANLYVSDWGNFENRCFERACHLYVSWFVEHDQGTETIYDAPADLFICVPPE